MIKIKNLIKEYKSFDNFRIECPELNVNKGEILGV